MTTWLVTGGAGYIGSHVVRELLASGRDVVVYDDFSAGVEARVPAGTPVVRADVRDVAALAQALRDHAVDGVVHLAAKKAAGESVEIPVYYYRENVEGMIALLEAMQAAQVRNLVYSSSAAVYGTPEANPVAEDAPLRPESPYGETKVVGEWIARDCEVIGRGVDAEVVGRRDGDPPATFADTRLISERLGWGAALDLRAMVSSAWSAWSARPGRAR